jgi:Na+/serine symporter
MSEIYLRGRAFRGLAEGRIPWWIIISGWIVFGSFALMALSAAILSGSLFTLPILAIAAILCLILWRGTVAKRSIEKHKRRRK